MDLKSIFLQRLSYNADITGRNTTSKAGMTNSFDSFLSMASNNTKTDFSNNKSNISDNNISATKEKNVVKSDNSNINDSKENELSKDDSKTDTKTNTKTTDKEKTEVNKREKTDETTKHKEKEIIEKISDELGVSVEQIQDILQQLNITAQDLADSNNLLSFMQKLINVDNPIDLLSVEGVKDMFESVKSIVEEVTKFQQDINTNVDVELSDDITVTKSKTDTVVISEDNLSQDNNDTKQNDNVLNNTQVNTEINSNNIVVNQMGQENNQQQNMGSNQQQSNELLTGIQNNTQKEVFKAFTEVINKTEAGRNVDTADVIKQIVERLKTDFTSEISEIKVTLKPEYLGDISLKVASQNGVITAQFTAENQRIKEIIEANFEQLKDVLNEQGIQVSELSVNIGNEESNNSEQFNFSGQKSESRIKDIIDNSFLDNNETEPEIEDTYIDEGQVLAANVSYTA